MSFYGLQTDLDRMKEGKISTPSFVALYQNSDGSVHDKILSWDIDNKIRLNYLGSWSHRFLIGGYHILVIEDEFIYNKINIIKEFQYIGKEPDKEDNIRHIISRNLEHYIFLLWFDDKIGMQSKLT